MDQDGALKESVQREKEQRKLREARLLGTWNTPAHRSNPHPRQEPSVGRLEATFLHSHFTPSFGVSPDASKQGEGQCSSPCPNGQWHTEEVSSRWTDTVPYR